MKGTLKTLRIWFAFFGIVIWIGIILTGFSNIHWFMYIPAVLLIFAAVTGICPSMMLINKLFGPKQAAP
jgi:hypothetical protein